MGRKNSESEHDQEFESDEEEELTMEEQVQNKIKELPTLADKIQAIAINTYLLEKRALDKQLEHESHVIELKHRKTYEPYLEEISKILSGEVDLTDQDLEGVEHLLTDQEQGAKTNYYPKKQIEEYWLKAFINSQDIAESVHPDDEKPLSHLVNVTATKTEDDKNFTVVFHFSENEWFTNQTIKKQFEIEGDQIKRSYGDAINWKEGKNLTVQIVKKKNKKKKTTVTKQIEKESFFNLFKEIDLTGDDEEEQNSKDGEEEGQTDVEKVERQYQICSSIYEEVIPRSLEFYLGVVGSLDMEGFEGLDDVPEEDDEDEEENTKKKSKGKASKRKGSHSSKE